MSGSLASLVGCLASRRCWQAAPAKPLQALTRKSFDDLMEQFAARYDGAHARKMTSVALYLRQQLGFQVDGPSAPPPPPRGRPPIGQAQGRMGER